MIKFLKTSLFILAAFCSQQAFSADAHALQQAFQKSVGFENKKDYTSAIDIIKPFASATSYEVNARLGLLSYLAGKHTESVAYYTKAIKLKPVATEPLWGITYPLAELKKWAELQHIYQKIITLDPKNSTANYRLGLGAYYSKDYVLAKKYFDSVLSLYPLDYSTLLMSGWTMYFLGKPIEAKELFNKVLMVAPNDKSATEGLALIK